MLLQNCFISCIFVPYFQMNMHSCLTNLFNVKLKTVQSEVEGRASMKWEAVLQVWALVPISMYHMAIFPSACSGQQVPFWGKKLTFSMDVCSVHSGSLAILEECAAVLFPSSQPLTLVQDLFPGKLWVWVLFFSYTSSEMNETKIQSNM